MAGRIKVQLAAMLSEALEGRVYPDELDVQRTGGSITYDPARWVGRVYRGTLSHGLSSYSTMTKCVRNGFTVSRDGSSYEIFAKPDAPHN